jgi:hypothetical protein
MASVKVANQGRLAKLDKKMNSLRRDITLQDCKMSGISKVDSTVINGELVDVGALSDGALTLLHVDRRLGEKILLMVYTSSNTPRGKDGRRTKSGKKLLKAKAAELKKQFSALLHPEPDLLGLVVNTSAKDKDGKETMSVTYAEKYLDEAGTLRTAMITVEGVLKHLTWTCDNCGRFSLNQCEFCPFRMCTKFCAMAAPFRHHQPCPM